MNYTLIQKSVGEKINCLKKIKSCEVGDLNIKRIILPNYKNQVKYFKRFELNTLKIENYINSKIKNYFHFFHIYDKKISTKLPLIKYIFFSLIHFLFFILLYG